MEDKPPSPKEPYSATDGSAIGTTDRGGLSDGGPEQDALRLPAELSTELFAPLLPLASTAAAAARTAATATTTESKDDDNNRKRSAADSGLDQGTGGGGTQQRSIPFVMNLPQEPNEGIRSGQVVQVLPAQASPPTPAASSGSTGGMGLEAQAASMLQLPSFNNMFGLPPAQLQQMLLEQMSRMQAAFPGSQMQPNFGMQGFPNFLMAPQQTMFPPGNAARDSQGLQMDASGTIMAQPFPATAGFLPSTSSSTSLSHIQPSSMSGSTVDIASIAQSPAAGNDATWQQQPVAVDDACLSGRSSIVLYMSLDEEALSPYQCLVRKNIELFEAQQVDVDSNAQGRNKPIILGQVGIRCIHCSSILPKKRARGATYYPRELKGLYQAAQNQAKGHLEKHCLSIPSPVRAELLSLKDSKSSPGSGKNYWADGVKVLGVYEDSQGLRFEKRTTTQNPGS